MSLITRFKAAFNLSDSAESNKVVSEFEGYTAESGSNPIVSSLRERKINRDARFKEYDQMSADPIIAQAMEMMADDATQYDIEREKTVWIESENKKFEKFINNYLLENLEPYIDTISYYILKYGEFAFKCRRIETPTSKSDSMLFDDEPAANIEKKFMILPVKNLANLNHLMTEDGVHFYVVTDKLTSIRDNKLKTYTDDEFVHFVNYSLENTQEIELNPSAVDFRFIQDTDEDEVVRLHLLSGESLLTDKLAETLRILNALENSLINFRMGKSQLVRVVNVDVPPKADENKIKNIVNAISSKLTTNESFNKADNHYRTDSTYGAPVVITNPVHGDKGRISVEEFSSSVDIKEIVDIEYFRSKFFAGLRMPPAFFGMDPNPGPGSTGSFVRMDIKYARVVKKNQRVIINGVGDLVEKLRDFYGFAKDIDYKIRIVRVNSSEDIERSEETSMRIGLIDQVFQSLFNQETGKLDLNKVKLAKEFYETVIPLNAFSKYLESVLKNEEEEISKNPKKKAPQQEEEDLEE